MPVVTIGENTADDYSGCADAALWDSSSHGGENTLWIGSSGYYMTLIKFSGLSNISTPVTVNSSGLYLYMDFASGTPFSCAVKRLLRNWVESEATDAVYSTGNSWTSSGGTSDGNDRSGTDSGPYAVSTTTGQYYSVSTSQLASDTEDFIDGTYSNYGWHLDEQDSPVRSFVSSDSTDGQRPYLSVDYTAGGGGLDISIVMHHRRMMQ